MSANVHFYLAKHSGLTKKEAMYDHQRGRRPPSPRYHEDFRPDFQAKPVAPAKVFELLDLQFIEWPGQNLPDETPWQYLEAEYMKADEYDALLADPEGYFRRSLLPRFGTAFGSAGGHAAVHRLHGSRSHALQPAGLRQPGPGGRHAAAGRGRRRVLRLAEGHQCRRGRRGRPSGHPAWNGRCSAKAPYDVLADTLRGTKGIMIDRFRQPDKILAAAERFVPLMIDICVRQGGLVRSRRWSSSGCTRAPTASCRRPTSAPSTGPRSRPS